METNEGLDLSKGDALAVGLSRSFEQIARLVVDRVVQHVQEDTTTEFLSLDFTITVFPGMVCFVPPDALPHGSYHPGRPRCINVMMGLDVWAKHVKPSVSHAALMVYECCFIMMQDRILTTLPEGYTMEIHPMMAASAILGSCDYTTFGMKIQIESPAHAQVTAATTYPDPFPTLGQFMRNRREQ